MHIQPTRYFVNEIMDNIISRFVKGKIVFLPFRKMIFYRRVFYLCPIFLKENLSVTFNISGSSNKRNPVCVDVKVPLLLYDEC